MKTFNLKLQVLLLFRGLVIVDLFIIMLLKKLTATIYDNIINAKILTKDLKKKQNLNVSIWSLICILIEFNFTSKM